MPADRKGKGASTTPTADERSPLLGQSSTNSNSVAVRHGRGLLDDDDDNDGDDEEAIPNGQGLAPSDTDSITRTHRRRTRTILCYSLLSLLGLAFITFAVIHVWLGRFVSEHWAHDGVRLQERAREALVFSQPERVAINDITKDGATLQVDMRMGVHVPTVFGWNGTFTPHRRLPFSTRVERRVVGWATRRVGQVTLDVNKPVIISPLTVSSEREIIAPREASPHSQSTRSLFRNRPSSQISLFNPTFIISPDLVPPQDAAMAQLSLSEPITLPLHFPKNPTKGESTDSSWLRLVQLSIPLSVLDAQRLAVFINDTVREKGNAVNVHLQHASIALGRQDDGSWFVKALRHYGAKSVEDVVANATFTVPDSPDIPSDPAELVKLKSYSLVPIPQPPSDPNPGNDTCPPPLDNLAVYANARVINPGYEQLARYGLDLDIPFAWPYRVQLPVPHKQHKKTNKGKHDETDVPERRVLLAAGVVEPFKIPSSSKHFDVSINATVQRTDNASTDLSRSLSAFVTRFVSGENNTAIVSFDPSSPFAASLPSFLVPLIRDVEVQYAVPGLPPDERELLKDLQIKDMKVHGSEDGSGGFQVDGIMEGRIVFPEGMGMDALEDPLNITAVWPDILLYDNLPPASDPDNPDDDDGKMPPSPLPLNAFARFRTTDFTPAETVKLQDGTTIMRAHVKNVPFEVLRADVLRRWIAKIVFSGGKGVRTGIKGVSQARATLRGFGDVELHKLPVLGVFYAQNPYGL